MGWTRTHQIRSNFVTGEISTLRPRENSRHFPDDIFKWIFLNENIWISIEISLKFVVKGEIKIYQYWFRSWFGALQATSHYLNQSRLHYRHMYASNGLNDIKPCITYLLPLSIMPLFVFLLGAASMTKMGSMTPKGLYCMEEEKVWDRSTTGGLCQAVKKMPAIC